MKNRGLVIMLVVLAAGCADSSGTGSDAYGDTSLAGLPTMPLRTEGRFIVDAEGRRVKLAGYNWNDGEGPMFTMSGLASQHRDDIAQRLARLGFNTIRLVWSNQLVEQNPMVQANLLAANRILSESGARSGRGGRIAWRTRIDGCNEQHISDAIYCCK